VINWPRCYGKSSFVEHLNKCSDRVSKWPKWKRKLLGATGFEDPVGKKDGRVKIGPACPVFYGPSADMIGENILRRFDNEMMSNYISENMCRDLFIGNIAGFVVWLDDEDRIQVTAFGGKGYDDKSKTHGETDVVDNNGRN
jgi:hypothetical protein